MKKRRIESGLISREVYGLIMEILYPYHIRLPKYFGNAIKAQRKKKTWTQLQLANWTGTSVKFISNIEQGKSTAQLDKVFDLLKALDLQLYLSDKKI